MTQSNKRGGKREGAGRKRQGLTTKAMSLKLDIDLFETLCAISVTKNRFINDAVREKLIRDNIEVKSL